MSVSSLVVLVLAQSLAFTIGSPLDTLPNLDGSEFLLDNPDVFTANIGGPEEPLFFETGGLATTLETPVPLFPESNYPGTSFDVALGGLDLLAANNECYPKQRACCRRSGFNTCYDAPSAQCGNAPIVCCDRVDTVSLSGIGCTLLSPTSQQPITNPQDGEEVYPGVKYQDLTDEEWFNLLLWGS